MEEILDWHCHGRPGFALMYSPPTRGSVKRIRRNVKARNFNQNCSSAPSTRMMEASVKWMSKGKDADIRTTSDTLGLIPAVPVILAHFGRHLFKQAEVDELEQR